jgi:hypothetical protein
MDVLVAATQSAGNAGKSVGVVATLREKMAGGGVGELVAYSPRGLGARIVHVAVTTLAMKTVTTRVHCWTCDHDTVVTMSFGGTIEMATRSGFRNSKGRLF